MNENRLIIAAAGSGKTSYLIDKALNKNGNILILTYTISNENVLVRRITNKHGCIPPNITIQTWFSFLLQHGVKPYQGSMFDSLYEVNVSGMKLVNEQSGLRFNGNNGPVYWPEINLKHYFTNDYKIYSDKISKFVFKCNEKTNGSIIGRLSRIYDSIMIDEVQDLAGYDLELLKLLFQSPISVFLVGDPRQVTYLTHIERKHKKYKNGKIKEFVEKELGKHIACEIDERTLNESHRCNEAVCGFASLLYPHLPETKSCSCCCHSEIVHQGVFLVRPQDLTKYIRRVNVTQLRWSKGVEVDPSRQVMNFGESKGETFENVLIYPTTPMVKWIKNNTEPLTDEAKAKFYVALTRARHSVAIAIDGENNINTRFLQIWQPD